jgi:hypothetical protein
MLPFRQYFSLKKDWKKVTNYTLKIENKNCKVAAIKLKLYERVLMINIIYLSSNSNFKTALVMKLSYLTP